MTFFERQTELPQPFPEAADADLHIVFRQEPGSQFGKRRIGFAHNAGTKSFVMRGKLRLGAACPGTGARLSRLLPTPQNFVDIGHADPEDGRSGISARSRIHCRHHPFAQVLRVSSPHHCSPSNQRRKGIKNSTPLESASDSINSEDALARACRAGWTIQKTFTLCVETVFGAVRRACLCVFDLSELEKFSRKEVRKLHLEVQSILTPGETK